MPSYYYIKYHQYAKKYFTEEEMDNNTWRLIKFMGIIKTINYNYDFSYWLEKVGYYYEKNEKDLYFRFTEKKLQSIYAIITGNKELLKRLYNESSENLVGHHKALNIELAIKYNQINIIKYLMEIGWYNIPLSIAIGQHGTPELFDKLYKDDMINNNDLNEIIRICILDNNIELKDYVERLLRSLKSELLFGTPELFDKLYKDNIINKNDINKIIKDCKMYNNTRLEEHINKKLILLN